MLLDHQLRGTLNLSPDSEQTVLNMDSQVFTAWANELGFADVGFCPPDPFLYSQRIVQDQAPLPERRQLRFDPVKDYPQCRSIAVLLWPYLPAKSSTRGSVFVDSYYAASNAAYHASQELEKRLLGSGRFAKANVAYPAKEAALRAGMGVAGQNSLLITPLYGSRVVLILMATDIETDCKPLSGRPASCIKCGKCIHACPVGALDENGLSHPEKCLRNYMMEGVVVPEDLRAKIGMRLIGCDICQRACPMQPAVQCAQQHQHVLQDFMTEEQGAFTACVALLAQEIGRNAARPQRVRAQAALLAGNSKRKDFLPVLRKWAELPFDAVREHALWAIKEIESACEQT